MKLDNQNYNSKYVSFNGIEIYVESFGDLNDPACLLISGAGASARFWTDHLCKTISAERFFVIRYDHRDVGLSSAIDFNINPYTVYDLANDSKEILKSYNIAKAHIVGHSMGGIIAQIFAVNFPEYLITFTSMSVGIVDDVSPSKEVMNTLMENIPKGVYENDLLGFMKSWRILHGDVILDEELAIAYIKDLYERSIHKVGVAWNHINCQKNLKDIPNKLANNKIPALFIHGSKDLLIPIEHGLKNAEVTSNSNFKEIIGMGHMFFNKNIEDQIITVLLNHFKRQFYELKTGISDFRKLISNDGVTVDPNRLFVDKTLFIKAFLDHSNDVVLITRPRRWGKTSILSMLQHFLSKEIDGLPTKDLFNNLKISEYLNDIKYKKYQGSYPVILVSFKDLKGNTFEEIKEEIAEIVAGLYTKQEYLLDSLKKHEVFNFLTTEKYEIYVNKFIRIINKQATLAELKKSLLFLSELLKAYYNKKVFILIDEYDNAINNYFDKPEILKELIDFFGILFSSCMKDNDNLEKGLITGILRVAKANIFSGLNNPTEETVLDYFFSEYYGFTDTEVNKLLERTNFINKNDIKNWYNGYVIGNNTLYNPWSIMQCIAHSGQLQQYWVDSANPIMIKDLLINRSSREDKQKIRDLIKYNIADLKIELEKYVSLDDLQHQPEILWSLLIHTGYLTLFKNNNKVQVKLPNKEILLLIKKYVDNWFIAHPFLSKMANSLLYGEFQKFEEALRELFGDPAYSARIFSGGGRAANFPEVEKTKEFVYQFLIMTELRCINLFKDPEYEVFAEIDDVSINKTRPDLLVVNHKQKLCVVAELKVAKQNYHDLKKIANDEALAQIDKNKYAFKYQEQYGYKILKLGIAFKGDNFELAYE